MLYTQIAKDCLVGICYHGHAAIVIEETSYDTKTVTATCKLSSGILSGATDGVVQDELSLVCLVSALPCTKHYVSVY